MQCRVAVVQYRVKQFDHKKNFRTIERYIAKAAKKKADIIVFPEDAVEGWIKYRPDLVDYQHARCAQFQKLAKQYKIAIVPGSIMEGDAKGIYNTTYFIDSDGSILGTYRKVHLWLPERGAYTPGHTSVVCQTKFGKIGLAICWDLAFPELFRSMARKNAQIVICPSYWCYEDAGRGQLYDKRSEEKAIDAFCVERAFENEIILVFCNAAGVQVFGHNREKLVGHSQVTEPFKGVVKKFNHHREGMFIAEVDTSILRQAETSYKIKNDLRKNLRL